MKLSECMIAFNDPDDETKGALAGTTHTRPPLDFFH